MDALSTNFSKEELKDIFQKMDWDKNGSITPLEFKSYLLTLKQGDEDMSMEEVLHAFDQIDKDGSKNIQWEEFLEAMTAIAARRSTVSEAEIDRVFGLLDHDKDGFITGKEAKKGIHHLKKVITKIQDEDDVDRWVEEADFDSDGRISLEEFKLSIAGNSLVDNV